MNLEEVTKQVIIIEGTDRVGKTTLARALARQLKMAYIHYGPMPDWWQAKDYTERILQHAVYDRYHWSEAVYAPILGRKPIANAHACKQIDRELHAGGPYTSILLIATEDYFTSRPDDEQTPVTQRTANAWYIQHELDFDLIYNVAWGYPDPEEVAAQVLQRVQHHNSLGD